MQGARGDVANGAVERSIDLPVPREFVFRFFSESKHFSSWWGEGTTIDPEKGGRVSIVHPGGARASGRVEVIQPPSRFVFTFGDEGEGRPLLPGSSRVELTLLPSERGCFLRLRHDLFPSVAVRRGYEQGWRYQLSLLHGAATRGYFGPLLPGLLGDWWKVWNEEDPEKRRAALGRCAAPDVGFWDRFSALSGKDDLLAHIAATKAHMVGMSLRPEGEPQLCGATVIQPWSMVGGEGRMLGKGRNVFALTSSGRIASAHGFWEGA